MKAFEYIIKMVNGLILVEHFSGLYDHFTDTGHIHPFAPIHTVMAEATLHCPVALITHI